LRDRGYRLALVGGPKTMDYDLRFADATFGFRTAVDQAVDHIRTAHWEAESQDRIAVVELFGAGSGFIALHAGFLSGVADVILIPEFRYPAESILARVKERLAKRRHALIVVAEGALLDFEHGQSHKKELAFASLVGKLRECFPGVGLVDVRPRYLIRGTTPRSYDLDLAKYTGYLMVDTALRGFTDCSVQLWQNEYVLVPLALAAASPNKVPLWSPYFWYMAQRYLI